MAATPSIQANLDLFYQRFPFIDFTTSDQEIQKSIETLAMCGEIAETTITAVANALLKSSRKGDFNLAEYNLEDLTKSPLSLLQCEQGKSLIESTCIIDSYETLEYPFIAQCKSKTEFLEYMQKGPQERNEIESSIPIKAFLDSDEQEYLLLAVSTTAMEAIDHWVEWLKKENAAFFQSQQPKPTDHLLGRRKAPWLVVQHTSSCMTASKAKKCAGWTFLGFLSVGGPTLTFASMAIDCPDSARVSSNVIGPIAAFVSAFTFFAIGLKKSKKSFIWIGALGMTATLAATAFTWWYNTDRRLGKYC